MILRVKGGGGGGGDLAERINFPLHKASYVLQIVTTCPSSSNVHARQELLYRNVDRRVLPILVYLISTCQTGTIGV
jgi:hypothetical protein